MKKFLIILCLIVFPVFAQGLSDKTFSENNPNLIRDKEPHTFNNNTFVYIQGISDKPQPKTWKDNLKIKLFGSMEIPINSDLPRLSDKSSFSNPQKQESGVKTKNFFGSEKEIKYISHTSNWDFIIQPMDNNTVSVQENIKFLLTEDTPITRSWPIKKNELTLINAQIDGNRIFQDENSENTIINFSILSAGLHTITLHYTISVQTNEVFNLPLIDDHWPLTTSVFSGIILNGKIELKDIHFLLGKNFQEIPQNFFFSIDNKENIFFKNNYILPAFTQIQISANAFDTAPQQIENLPFSISEFLFFVTILVTILLYLILSACEIYFSSLTYLLKRFRKYTLNPFKRWFYRINEIIIGCFILFSSSILISYLFNIYLSYIYWILIFIIAIIIIIVIDVFVFYPQQETIYKIHQNKGER